MRVFFVSSAFAKRCIDESGTEQTLSWCERADEPVLSVLAMPETTSAFCRLQREGWLTPAAHRQIKQDLMAELADASLCDTTPEFWQCAVQGLEAGTVRGRDALHVGAAQEAEADVFVSADARQLAATRAPGLPVVDL